MGGGGARRAAVGVGRGGVYYYVIGRSLVKARRFFLIG